MTYILRRLTHPQTLKKVFVERLTEPLHLNLISAFGRCCRFLALTIRHATAPASATISTSPILPRRTSPRFATLKLEELLSR